MTSTTQHDFDSKNSNNESALYTACIEADREKVKDLIQKGTRTDTKIDNKTCLQIVYSLYSKYYYEFKRNKRSIHISSRYLEIMKLLIYPKYQLNPDFISGNTIAHDAAARNEIKIIELLIKHDVPLATRNNSTETALSIAYQKGFYKISNILIKSKTGLNKQYSKEQQTLLHDAVFKKDLPTLELLIEYGANLDICDNLKKTALYYAYRIQGFKDFEGQDMIKLLIKSKADLSKQYGKGGKTLLHYVALNNQPKLMDFLITHGANINSCDNVGDTPLHLACLNGHVQIVTKLIKNGAQLNIVNKYQEHPIFASSRKGFEAITKLLIKSKSDLNKKNSQEKTLLHYAIFHKNIDTARLLIENGENINSRDNAAETPLHLACLNGDIPMVKLLLQKGAFVHLKNIDGNTPMHIACQTDNLPLVILLFQYHAKISIKNDSMVTPFYIVYHRQSPQIIDFFLSKRNVLEQTDPYAIPLLLKRSLSINNPIKTNPRIAFSSPSVHSKRGVKRHSSRSSVSSHHHKKRKTTTDHKDMELNIPYSNKSLEDIKRLISQKNFNMDCKDKEGKTLLHRACCNGDTQIVKLLVEYGAQVTIQDNNQDTPLDIARRENFNDLVRYLHTQKAS